MASRRKPKKKPASRKKSAPKRGTPWLRWAGIAILWLAVIGAGAVAWFAHDLPDTSALWDVEDSSSVTFLDREGRLIARRGAVYGPPVRLDSLPDHLPGAVMAVEDRRFYAHPGIDPIGLSRAAYANFRAGYVVQGGSTITQQLAKNLFLTNERTIRRKAQEMLLALWLERKFTKDEIFALYLNRVYFGGGAWGIEAASQRYFSKPASEVTLGESALLAGLLKAPSRYNPSSDVARAEARATVVLDVMVEAGKITPEQRETAFDAPIVVSRASAVESAQYFMDWVDTEVRQLVGEVNADLIVETTMDLPMQRMAGRTLREGLKQEAIDKGAEQGALIALGPQGEVLALAGGRDYTASQFNRAVMAHRQPGSAFKPFVYLTAMEAGLSPWTTRLDAPVRVGDWEPGNYGERYYGEVALKTGLEKSLNTVAVRLTEELGREKVARTAQRMGIVSRLAPTRSLALGAQEVTPMELAAAYAPFANGGMGVIPHGITRIRTMGGQVLYERRGSGPGRVVQPDPLAHMNFMLESVVEQGTGRAARLPDRTAGGKTGTTNDFRDAWFAGYADRITTVVWVGNDDNRAMQGVTGGSYPAAIWAEFMRHAPPMRDYAAPAAPPPAAPAAQPPARPAEEAPREDPIGDLITTVRENGAGGD